MSTPRTKEIIAAAAKLFKEKGYHATTIQDVADEVGMLKGSLYYHIKSKEELLYLVTKEPIRELIERQKRLMESDLSPQQKIVEFIRLCFSRRKPACPSQSKRRSLALIFAMRACSKPFCIKESTVGIFGRSLT